MSGGRRIYLHIGAPKTGTTYLQDRLAINAKTLAEHDVHFPARSAMASPTLSQFRAALDLLGQDWGGPPGHADGGWEALTRRVRRLSGTVVISHEILAPATAEQAERAKQTLSQGGAEVHIVYSARDLARQLPAAWQESIKQGRQWTYRRFLRRVTTTKPWFARAFDLPAVLTTWGTGLPPERVHVVTVPPRGRQPLWQRFAEVVGFEPGWAPRESEAVNPSLGTAETQLLRQLNRRLERAAGREAPSDEVLLGLLADGRLMPHRSGPLLLPPRLHDWAQEEGVRWSEWIEGSGVHLAGDLADLIPSPPPDDGGYVDPDRVGSKELLGSALDALTAMTREAARRTDPDRAVSAKVRSRVRDADNR